MAAKLASSSAQSPWQPPVAHADGSSGDVAYVHVVIPVHEFTRLHETRPLLPSTTHPQYEHRHQRAAELWAHPLSDCSTRAILPIVLLCLVASGLAFTMLIYPRLLHINIVSVQLDPNSTIPVHMHISPPSVSIDLVSDMIITNPLLSDLRQMNLSILVYYPYFEPSVLIGHSKIDTRINLAARQSTSVRVPFQLRLPNDNSSLHQVPTLDKSSTPGLSDVVLAMIKECQSQSQLIFDLELYTQVRTWWWQFGGSRQDFRSMAVPCRHTG